MIRPRSARACLLLAFAAAASSRGVAGDPPEATARATPISLREALELAHAASPRLGSLAAREDVAAAGLDAEQAARRPAIDLALAYQRRSHVPEFIVRPAGLLSPPVTVFPDIPDRFRSQVALSIPVYTGGRIESGITAAERSVAAARYDTVAGLADLDLETAVAYWQLVASRERQRVVAAALASYEAHLKDCRDRVEVGLAAENEALAVQVMRDRADLGRIRAGGEALVANADLARLVGLGSSPLLPSEALRPPEPPSGGEEDLVQEALASRPERAAAAARIAAADARAAQIHAALRPHVAAGASYDFANPNTDIVPLESDWEGTWRVDVAAKFLLSDGGVTRARVAAAEAEARAARHELDELDRAIRLQVVRARTALQTAHAALGVADGAVGAAEENVRVSRDRFREGLLPSSDLLDAETDLLLAELERTEAVTAAHRARAALIRAVGRSLL